MYRILEWKPDRFEFKDNIVKLGDKKYEIIGYVSDKKWTYNYFVFCKGDGYMHILDREMKLKKYHRGIAMEGRAWEFYMNTTLVIYNFRDIFVFDLDKMTKVNIEDVEVGKNFIYPKGKTGISEYSIVYEYKNLLFEFDENITIHRNNKFFKKIKKNLENIEYADQNIIANEDKKYIYSNNFSIFGINFKRIAFNIFFILSQDISLIILTYISHS